MAADKSTAARLSVLSNTALVLMKLVVGALSGSISIIAEAAHSGLDLLAALIAWASVRAADRPPDEKHPYGHGKLENISGTVEASLILFTAAWIAWEGVKRMLSPAELKEPGLGLLVMLVSAGANVVVSRYLFRVARQTDSIALEADAHHLSVDVYTSIGVFIGLVLIQLTHWKPLDGLVALILALAISKIAWDLTHRAAQPLLDTRLPDEEEEEIVSAICEDPRVIDCHAVRSRSAGAWRYLDAHITVAPGTTLQEADELEEELRDRLRKKDPKLDVMLHVEPAHVPMEERKPAE